MKLTLDQIDDTAYPRDRTLLNPDRMAELEKSILNSGLRTPIEVTKTGDTYALISGFRRLTAHRRLVENWQLEKFNEIEVRLIAPRDVAQALTLMVEENDIREDLSPWEKSSFPVHLMRHGHFETLDAAIATL